MKPHQVKQVIATAAKLPPAKGRALVAALALAAKEPLPVDPLEEAVRIFEIAMANAAINALEESLS